MWKFELIMLCEGQPKRANPNLSRHGGTRNRECGLRGNLDDPDSVLLPDRSHTYGAFVWTQNVWLTRRQRENFRFIPLYEVTDEPYTVYFTKES